MRKKEQGSVMASEELRSEKRSREGSVMALEEMRSEKRICVSDFNSLDESLLTEILIRLPSSKTANRLKLVCRRWYALISSDYFFWFSFTAAMTNLFPRFLGMIPEYSLVCQYFRGPIDVIEKSWLIDFRSNGQFIAHHMLDLSFLPPRPVDRILVKASCEDLLLCCFNPDAKRMSSQPVCFYVCNPLTKQWVALPTPIDPDFKDIATGFLWIPVPCSLCGHPGVNNSRYKFMVVRIRGGHKFTDHVSELNVQLYSSEEGRWRNCVVSYPLGLLYRYPNTLVAYRGMLHWLAKNHILVYDPYNAPERFSRVIDLPPHPSDFSIYSFEVCQGCLRVAMGKDVAYTWELEDYDTGKWSLVLEPHEWEKGGLRFYVHVDGNVVRKFLANYILFLCNTQSGSRHLLHLDASDFFLLRDTVRQIVNQWWPTPVPSLGPNMQACTIK